MLSQIHHLDKQVISILVGSEIIHKFIENQFIKQSNRSKQAK